MEKRRGAGELPPARGQVVVAPAGSCCSETGALFKGGLRSPAWNRHRHSATCLSVPHSTLLRLVVLVFSSRSPSHRAPLASPGCAIGPRPSGTPGFWRRPSFPAVTPPQACQRSRRPGAGVQCSFLPLEGAAAPRAAPERTRLAVRELEALGGRPCSALVGGAQGAGAGPPGGWQRYRWFLVSPWVRPWCALRVVAAGL